MEFGALVFPHPLHAAEQAKLFEAEGFTHAFFGDVPLCLGDAYSCMALAASATRSIKLATHIAIPMRAEPVIVQSIATINALAPGRVVLGFGTGSFSRAMAGLAPIRLEDFGARLRVIRELLTRGESIYEVDGLRRPIRFSDRELECINLKDPIPLYVAAAGRKSAALAGELGDGVITTGLPTPEQVASLLERVAIGARRAGRQVGKLPCVLEGPICVVRPGETLESSRVVDAVAAWVIVGLKFSAYNQFPPEALPAAVRPVYQELLASIGDADGLADERHLAVWSRVFTLGPHERRFVTPEVIRATAICGPREEVVERLRALERAGATQFCVWFPPSRVDEYLSDLREVRARI